MTTQITIRIPDELSSFIKERAEALHETSTSVVVAALKAEKRRLDVEREIAALRQHPYDEDPDLSLLSTEQVGQMWKDLD